MAFRLISQSNVDPNSGICVDEDTGIPYLGEIKGGIVDPVVEIDLSVFIDPNITLTPDGNVTLPAAGTVLSGTTYGPSSGTIGTLALTIYNTALNNIIDVATHFPGPLFVDATTATQLILSGPGQGSSGVTSITVTNAAFIDTIRIFGGTFTSFTSDSYGQFGNPGGAGTANYIGGALSVDEVSNLLVAIDTGVVLAGVGATLDVTQTPAAIPNAAGQAAMTSLALKNITITADA